MLWYKKEAKRVPVLYIKKFVVTCDCFAGLECEEIGAKMKQMQQIYDTQELTPADINRINLERQELRRKKDSLEKQSSEYDEDIWNYEKEMAKILERVL